MKLYAGIRCILVALVIVSSLLAEDLTPTQKLASDLITTKNKADRAQLLDQQKNLINSELGKELIAQGDRLRVQSDFESAMTAFELAKQVAEKISSKPILTEAL